MCPIHSMFPFFPPTFTLSFPHFLYFIPSLPTLPSPYFSHSSLLPSISASLPPSLTLYRHTTPHHCSILNTLYLWKSNTVTLSFRVNSDFGSTSALHTVQTRPRLHPTGPLVGPALGTSWLSSSNGHSHWSGCC